MEEREIHSPYVVFEIGNLNVLLRVIISQTIENCGKYITGGSVMCITDVNRCNTFNSLDERTSNSPLSYISNQTNHLPMPATIFDTDIKCNCYLMHCGASLVVLCKRLSSCIRACIR